MFFEKIQLINRIAQIPQKNNNYSNDKNMISEIALVFWCLSKLQTRQEFLAKNFNHTVTEKSKDWEGISKIIQIGYSDDSDNWILEYITNKTEK